MKKIDFARSQIAYDRLNTVKEKINEIIDYLQADKEPRVITTADMTPETLEKMVKTHPTTLAKSGLERAMKVTEVKLSLEKIGTNEDWFLNVKFGNGTEERNWIFGKNEEIDEIIKKLRRL